MIQAEHLSKTYAQGRGRVVQAVKDATFSVGEGEIFGLLGPNGAGKTTLLRMLGTIITPSGGTCAVDGVRADEAPREVRRRIGFLSGNTRLYGRLTTREVLAYFGRLYDMDPDAIAVRTEELADRLSLGPILDRRCDRLSTGQTQKVSIARVILHEPCVLILDEPTAGLDIMSSRTILDFIQEAKGRGGCVIFSTHYMTEAELLCDRMGLIHDGRILALGTKDSFYARTGTDNLKDAFLSLVEGGLEPLD